MGVVRFPVESGVRTSHRATRHVDAEVHVELAGIVAAVTPNVPPRGHAASVPAQPAGPVTAALGTAAFFTCGDGYVSVNTTPCSLVVLGFVTWIVSTDVPPDAIDGGTKLLAIVSGDRMFLTAASAITMPTPELTSVPTVSMSSAE